MKIRNTQESDRATLSKNSFLAFALAISLAGCVAAPENEESKEENEPEPTEEGAQGEHEDETEFIATSYTTSTHIGTNLEIKIRPLELIDSEILKLSLEVHNSSDEAYVLQDVLSDPENLYSANNSTLIDPTRQERYFNNELGDGSCYCTFTDGALASGESVNLEVMFPPPPEGTESMTVTTPITSPFFDVPVIETSDSVDEEYSEGEILPLTMISDDEDSDGWSEREDEEELSILLSSDVLFDFDSADLTSDSDEVIEQVASEIDQSDSDNVKVEGYTDNEGSDSVNIPLSEERAESVESALSGLVTRDGISFDIEGHGSSDPVADNETEEGRELNRRVTVTFEK